MASIAGLGKIGLPRLSENMDPEDARACTIISRAPSTSIWSCLPTRRTAPARTPLHWDASSA